ncbi:MAG: hypothetical protein A2X86_01285 [Bdellovibrionales bacterium GWA2_49_15]|nr:MAG: hypothetical protein A2X86_01285 [Bdellovibrionales bacterium GWA2_49_15]
MRASLLEPTLSEARLLSLVGKLSSGFTTDRHDLDSYGLSAEQVSAYTYFYFPTNIPALSYLLDRLPSSLRHELKTSIFMDWGTGPGTYLVAWARYFSLEKGAKLFAIDQSPLMLKQAQKVWSNFGAGEIEVCWENPQNILTSKRTQLVGTEKKMTLCFGNSMNEMGCQKTLQIIQHLAPDFVIFLEPGTPAVFKEMLVIRRELTQLGHKNVFPCPESKLSCPMDQSQGHDWCHQIMLTTHDPSIERLSQKLHLDRRTRPLLAHVYHRAGDLEKSASARIVRSFPPTKASYRFLVCRMGEECLENIEIEFLIRDTDSPMRKKLDKLRSGDILNFEMKEALTAQKIRAKGLR